MHGAIVGAFGEVLGEKAVGDELVGVFEDAAEPEEVPVGRVAGERAALGDGWRGSCAGCECVVEVLGEGGEGLQARENEGTVGGREGGEELDV